MSTREEGQAMMEALYIHASYIAPHTVLFYSSDVERNGRWATMAMHGDPNLVYHGRADDPRPPVFLVERSDGVRMGGEMPPFFAHRYALSWVEDGQP